MKKFSFLLSLLLIAAFVLSACGPVDESDATPGAGVTPGVGDVTEPTLDVMPEGTATVAEPMPTEAVTEAATDAPVVETPTVETTEAAADETPVSGVPVTGDDDCNPLTVQGLLDMEVFDAAGTQVGDVDSLIVIRGGNAAPNSNGNAAPAAGSSRVAYVVVDVENEDDEAVIPFEAFDLTVRDNDVTGMDTAGETPAADAAQATPAAGDTVQTTPVVEDAANEVDACGITVANLQADALADLPRLADDLDLTVETWDSDYRAYWNAQGVAMPEAAQAGLGTPVLLNDEFNAVPAENVNGDDLGEVDDFIFANDGQFQYAVLAAGGFLGIGEKYVPVPMSMVQWNQRDTDNNVDDVGYILIDTTEEDWQNAPSFDSLDEIDVTVDGWDEEIQSFWNTVTPPVR